MKTARLILSFLTCAISFPKKLIERDWPTIVDEPPTHPGGFIHTLNNVACETVRANANFFTKGFAFAVLLQSALIALCLIL